MINYRSFLLCLLAVYITANSVIESRYSLLLSPFGYYNYQIVQGTQEKVKLEVFYESLCPYCIQFHTGPLIDVITKIGSYLDFKAYPYGNAKQTVVNGKTETVCQHGVEECYGNKLHACAINIIQNETLSEFYNSCMMSAKWGGRGSTDTDAINCGNLMGIDGTAVITCAQSQRGEDLLEYYGRETDKHPEKRGVPYILINGKEFNDDDDLMAKVCQELANPPPQCQQTTY